MAKRQIKKLRKRKIHFGSHSWKKEKPPMRFIKVPDLVTPLTLDGKPFVNPQATDEKDASGQPIVKKIELKDLSMHRVLMDHYISETKPPAGDRQPPQLKMGDGYKGIKRTAEIDRAFKDAKPGEIVGLEEETWAALKTCIEEKSWAGSALFGAQLIAFTDAIMVPVAEPAKKAAEPVQAQA